MIKAAIIGGSGFTGRELVKILIKHRIAEIEYITSRQYAGKGVSSVFSELKGMTGLKFSNPVDNKIFSGIDIAFVCLPHTQAMNYVAKLNRAGVKAVDLSADYRIKSAAEYKKWYNTAHKHARLLKKAVYGLPELFRKDIKNAEIIANPGCYAASVLLGLAPAFMSMNPKEVIIDAKTGMSGAGAKPTETSHFVNVNENVIPYNFGRKHRHIGEIEDVIKRKYGKKTEVVFTPQLVPVNRGILSVMYVKPGKKSTAASALKIYGDFYKNEKFVRVVEKIDLHAVQNTNFCDILIEKVPGKDLFIIISATDNLMKGASSQAVQNMNIMFGLPEKEGLL